MPRATSSILSAEPGSEPEDITDVPIDPNGAWASGALISTPADMATFFAALLGGELVPAAQLEEMMETRPGAGSPAGPGTNNAGPRDLQVGRGLRRDLGPHRRLPRLPRDRRRRG